MIKNNFLLNLFCLLHWKFCVHFYFFVHCTGARSFMFHCHWIFVLFQNEQYLSLHLTFQKFNTHVFFKNPQKIVFQHDDLQKKLFSTTVAEKVVHLKKKKVRAGHLLQTCGVTFLLQLSVCAFHTFFPTMPVVSGYYCVFSP